MLRMLTWDWMGPLGETGGSSVGKSGESDVASWDLQGGNPCMCQLRIDVLAPMSKYWTYWSHAGVMSPVSRCSLLTNRWLAFITALMAIRREKLGGGPTDWLASVWGIVSGALFLRSNKVHPTLLGQRERLPCMGTAHGKHTCCIRGLVKEAYVLCVSSFPCKVYIDLNHRDSWIWLTAWVVVVST
jgi:hypothetical protein